MDLHATLRGWLEARPEVRFAYLFGSRARGTAHAGSDIDVAVYLDPPASDPLAMARLSVELARALRMDPDLVDVRDLREGSVLFNFQVVRDGRCLLECDHRERIAFETRSAGAYYDFLPVLERHGRATRERFRGARA